MYIPSSTFQQLIRTMLTKQLAVAEELYESLLEALEDPYISLMMKSFYKQKNYMIQKKN